MTRHTRFPCSHAPRARGSAPKSIRQRAWNPWLALVACLVVGLHASAAHAQSGSPSVWVPFDSSPAGTPADIVLDAVASSPSSTRFDVFIHGMWRAERDGPDGRVYQQISIPGLQSTYTLGAPELPVYRFDLGIVTGASQATLAEVQVLSEQVIPGILPGPHLEEAPDTTGTPEEFVLDPAFYTDAAGYPQGPGMAAGAATRLSGTLRAAPGEVYPVHWDPSGNLHVLAHASYLYNHAGTPTQAQIPTNMSKTGAMTRLLNAPVVSPWTWVDPVHHAGYFLFIHSTAVSAEIDPLIWQKKLRGFGVAVIHTEDLGGYGDFLVRAAIENWYASTPANGDHYCLLVGDVEQIPLWRTGNFPPPVGGPILTDDYYGDADGDGIDDLQEEVHIGRLSYDGAGELDWQVNRILAYEDHPSSLQPFDKAVLVGWRSDPSPYGVEPRFENTQDQVAAASYSQPVSFTKLYGSNLALHNSWISSFVGQAGIVAYLGHGGVYDWWSWNWFQESYRWSDVALLNNDPVTPVVWSLTCSTGSIQVPDDCMLEDWMSQGSDGAVAAYGATRVAYTAGAAVQDVELFRAVFDFGITVHSQAIEFAEAACTKVDREFNELEFLMLGDPEMHIRRTLAPVPTWELSMPGNLTAGCPGCADQPVNIGVVVSGPGGNTAAVGVQVSLYKQPGPVNGGAAQAAPALPGAGPTEFQDNHYTDGEGFAHFIVPPLTEGTLYVTVTDDEGNALTQTIPVTGTASVGARSSVVVRLTAAPSVSSGPVRLSFDRSLEREARIALYDVSGRQVRVLRAPAGADEIRWDGADESGAPVAAGLYLAGMEGARRSTARIIIVR